MTETLLAEDPDNCDYLDTKAYALLQLCEFDAGAAAYESLLRSHPTAENCTSYGRALKALGRTGDTIRRRRECLKCERRFTTYERIDEIPYMVIKKDGRRERFERQKILQGLLKACEKRPVATPKLESIVDEIEGVVHEATERELTTTEIGEMIMHRLKKLDKVAYVRFASVYRRFQEASDFVHAVEKLEERS